MHQRRRDPTQPTVASAVTTTVARFIDEEYIPHHIVASKLSYKPALKSKMNVLRRRFGDLQLVALEGPGPIQDFRRELVESGKAVATVNLYLAQLRHMINWAIGREILKKVPFHRYGIKLLKGAVKRNRRLHPDEEERLIEATESLNNPRHWFQGQPMKDRIIMALDTGVRRGEMQLMQNKHVDWKRDPLLIRIPQENAKNGKERFIPVGTSRLLEVLQRRRFLGSHACVFGERQGGYVQSFRTAWETLLATANITDTTGSLDGDLHWHDLKHECGFSVSGTRSAATRDSIPARSRQHRDHSAIPERHPGISSQVSQGPRNQCRLTPAVILRSSNDHLWP